MNKNLILVGIMGSGKTTIGMRLSKQLNMPFLDADACIEDKHGKIPSLFEKGEAYFRAIETDTLREILQNTEAGEGIVLATGGGAVLKEENRELLKARGLVFFLHRDLEHIIETVDCTERPLLKQGSNALREIYENRLPYYLSASHHSIDTSGGVDNAVALIEEIWSKRGYSPE